MAAIPFTGALRVGLRKLPYTLPWDPSSSTPVPLFLQWLPDSYAAMADAVLVNGKYLRLRRTHYDTLDIANDPNPGYSSPNAVYVENGCASGNPLPDNTPQFARYVIPQTSGVIDPNDLQPVTASNPPAFDGFGGSSIPVVNSAGQLAFYFSTFDTLGDVWRALINPSSIQGWFGNTLPFDLVGQAQALDFANKRMLTLYQGFMGMNNITQITFDAGGNIASEILYQADLFGYDAIDTPVCAVPWNLRGWLIVADPSRGGLPLVPNGSMLFFVAPDLSSYSELVFYPAGPDVEPNDEGGYGPPMDYDLFDSPLPILVDTQGNIYYLQLDSTNTFLNVYSNVTSGASFFGTFTGYAGAGRILGGNA